MVRERAKQAFDAIRVRKHRPDHMIALCMALLMLLGLVVMYAIGPQRAQVLNAAFGTENYGDMYFFGKQLFSLLLAAGAFLVVSKIPIALLQKHASKILIAAIVACILLTIGGKLGLGVVQCSLGACRWFDFGPFNMQPAEFLKLGLLLFVAVFLGARYRLNQVDDMQATLIPMGVLLAVVAILVVVFQKDMGTGIAVVAIIATMLFAAGLDAKIGAMLVTAMLVFGVLFIVTAPHRMARVEAFFAGDSATTSDPETYHISHAKIAIGSGGLFGVGIGNSVQATGYLPEAINDSVFAIMGEIFGFVGLMAIIGLFSVLLFRILRVADHLPDITQRLIVAGVFGWLSAHVVLNIAAMTGIVPLTGITLPLLSFGGTSMVFIAGALGLVFQLSQYTVNDNRVEGGMDENSGSRRRVGRTRYATRSGS